MSDLDPDDDQTAPLIVDQTLVEDNDLGVVECNDTSPGEVSVKTYAMELVESVYKLIIIFYILFCVMILISSNASALNFGYYSNILLDVCVININSFNIVVAVLSVTSLVVTKRYRTEDIQSDKLSMMFYAVLLPACAWACISTIIFISYSNEGKICVYSVFTKYLFFTVMFVHVSGLLVLENNLNIVPQQLPWFPRSFNYFTVLLLIVALAHIIVWDISGRINHDFVEYTETFFNVSFNMTGSCNRSSSDREEFIIRLFRLVISQGLPVFAGLMIFMLVAVEKERYGYSSVKKYLFKSSRSIILGALMILFVVLHLMTYLTKVALLSGVSMSHEIILCFVIAFLCIRTVISTAGIIIVKKKYNSVVQWPRIESLQSSIPMFDRYFIWLGCFGQLFSFTKNIAYATYQLQNYFESRSFSQCDLTHLAMLCLLYPASALFLTQILYQSCLVEVSLDRKWAENVGVNRLFTSKTIYPAFVLSFINLADFLMCTYESVMSPIALVPDSLMIALFSSAALNISQMACMLQHLHAFVYFYLLSKISEFNPIEPESTASQITC